MDDARLATFVEHTYSRAAFAYRIGVLKEFLEFAFFTAHYERITGEAIDAFGKDGRPVADIAFLRSLPAPFFDGLTQASFSAELDRVADAVRALPTLSLTVPVMLDDEGRDAVGAWVRKEVGRDVMLDLSIDPDIAAGCQVVWHDRLYDFSLDHYLGASRTAFDERVRAALSPAEPAERP